METCRFAEIGKSKFSGLDKEKAINRLADLNSMASVDEIIPLKSIGLHKLKGNLRNYWSITINGPWRIIFRFENGDAFDVEIINYHKG